MALLKSIPTRSRFEDVDEEPPKSLKRARAVEDESPKASKSDQKKKLKGDDGVAVPALAADQDKQKKKKEKKKEQKEKSKEKEGEKQEAAAVNKKPAEREIAGGTKILDSKIGTGPMAKKGNKVRMRYIGKLMDGKVFDKNVKGKPVCNHFSLSASTLIAFYS